MAKTSIGEVISSNRKKKGLTQKALADQLNVTDKAVSKWERNIACPDINTVPKLAEILDVPIETLVNLPFTSKENTTASEKIPSDDSKETIPSKKPRKVTSQNDIEFQEEYTREFYRSRMWQLILKGAVGFVLGFIFVIVITIGDGDEFLPSLALVMGIGCAGIPYGWELLSRIIGNWYAVGSFPIVILIFCFKLVGAGLIGWFAYPVALLYNAIKAQKKGSKAKGILIVLLCTFVVLVITFFVFMFTTSAKNKAKANDITADNSYYQTVPSPTTSDGHSIALLSDATALNAGNDVYISICQKSLEGSIQLEVADKESGDQVVTPSRIQSAYFLTMKASGSKHYDYGDNIYLQNAVVVITSYRVNIANMTERDEWTVWVYPDIGTNTENNLTYVIENAYNDTLIAESSGEVYDWISKEYSDMSITTLEIPVL